MGLRFKKSLKIAPGVRLNIGNKGISSVSVGPRGAKLNVSKKGTRSTVSLPGTGLSYSSYTPHSTQTPNNTMPKTSGKSLGICLAIFAILFLLYLVKS